jgi:hypothetical protein
MRFVDAIDLELVPDGPACVHGAEYQVGIVTLGDHLQRCVKTKRPTDVHIWFDCSANSSRS